MLEARCLRRLTLAPDRHPRGQPHLSSASGLVLVGEHLYIAADDEHHLARLPAFDLSAELNLVRFAPGDLPPDFKERKRRKPDLEALIVIEGAGMNAPSLLVAWGSASRAEREFAFVFQLDARGALVGAPFRVGLQALCEPLRTRFGELNFEAGFTAHGELHLFQRANRSQPRNGWIRYAQTEMHAWLRDATREPPLARHMSFVDLGTIEGVPLGITDAKPRPHGGCYFTAVAEATDDAYADGACVGSVVGWMDAQGCVQACERLAGSPKVEGLALAGAGRLWMVTDADDPAVASELLEVQWGG